MEKKNNSGILVGILIEIITMLVVGIGLLTTRTIELKKYITTDKEQTNKNNQTDNSNTDSNTIIQTKLVDNLNCSSSETTFNGITVKVEQKTEDMVCVADVVTINGVDKRIMIII